MKRPYEDEQHLFLVAEMQRPMRQEDPIGPARGIITGIVAGAVCWTTIWLIVHLYRCCR